jgi:hypothetical protein
MSASFVVECAADGGEMSKRLTAVRASSIHILWSVMRPGRLGAMARIGARAGVSAHVIRAAAESNVFGPVATARAGPQYLGVGVMEKV